MLEFVYIQQGSGTRYIGDSIDSFSDGEVVLVGSRLPHVWKSNIIEKSKSDLKKCIAVVIQFPVDFLGNQFFQLTESKNINTLLKRAERGLVFEKDSKLTLAKKTISLLKLNGMERLIKFLDLLQCAAVSDNYKLLASPMFVDAIYNDDQKINKVFGYIMDNFTNEIKLSDAASFAAMNKTAFCRYFKKRTKKTFSTFLNEVRIGNACKLIREDDIPITEAAYLSGYNSPSYFYKQFKTIKGISPTQYQSTII
jgi:AraC-like DNA-binding protein